MPGPLSLARWTALALLLGLFAPAAQPQAANAYRPKLTGIMIDGPKKFTRAEIVAASGLVVGQPTSLPEIAAAANHLASVGVFRNVRYQYSNSADEISVQLHLEEETILLPCILDNFIWFKDDELMSDLRAHVPFFDASLPAGGAIIGEVETELSRLVATKSTSVQVMHIAYSPGLGAAISAHVFQLSGVPFPIRAVHFPGATEKFPAQLAAASKELLDQDYSRITTGIYARKNFLPVYEEKGYLQPDIRDAQVESFTPNQKTGGFDIVVSIPVAEGRVYKWNGAQWHGATKIPKDKLNDSLGQHEGAPTNLIAFNHGIESALHSYQKIGYAEANFDVKLILDQAASAASFDITLKEGAQFHMGELTISGVPEHAADAIRKAWKLHAGEVYDGTYLEEFSPKELSQVLNRAGARVKSIASSVALDHDKALANVTFTFK